MAFNFKSRRTEVKSARFVALRRTVVCVLVLSAYLFGSFDQIRTDSNGGWCAHFNGWMVCNSSAASDYTFGD